MARCHSDSYINRQFTGLPPKTFKITQLPLTLSAFQVRLLAQSQGRQVQAYALGRAFDLADGTRRLQVIDIGGTV
jgi:hypothetical protein